MQGMHPVCLDDPHRFMYGYPQVFGCPCMIGHNLICLDAHCMLGCPHTFGFPPYIWRASKHTGGHPNIQGGVQIYGDIQTYKGASKHMGDVQTYGGIQTYRGHQNIWGISKHTGGIQTWGHSKIQGVHPNMGVMLCHGSNISDSGLVIIIISLLPCAQITMWKDGLVMMCCAVI